MPPRVVPVFVSSTRLDLRPEREAVLRMRQTQFAGMEHFPLTCGPRAGR